MGRLAQQDPVAVRIHCFDANAERIVLRFGLNECHASLESVWKSFPKPSDSRMSGPGVATCRASIG
ncbi:hypothetical protein GCM10023195_01340 [Actinoallomurus liliacearum]|uniref:Uncharacterized protein n=1 Tax=Actinoallomurus liliacearum TaxID=1080073 RepID=A0ABP8T8N7_9ACTN